MTSFVRREDSAEDQTRGKLGYSRYEIVKERHRDEIRLLTFWKQEATTFAFHHICNKCDSGPQTDNVRHIKQKCPVKSMERLPTLKEDYQQSYYRNSVTKASPDISGLLLRDVLKETFIEPVSLPLTTTSKEVTVLYLLLETEVIHIDMTDVDNLYDTSYFSDDPFLSSVK
ncbi:hypothetical protein CHS0354_021632 [Potamilus streckersoni]|uniref:Uncharacterized protein n=1 Tax=Potamilus streckersoni TaxID=2493646 RepID=A0AAE0VZG6_9BIVA|nr:hypothetical protein CHS0354_021632 [Potamilus streckersoni]